MWRLGVSYICLLGGCRCVGWAVVTGVGWAVATGVG